MRYNSLTIYDVWTNNGNGPIKAKWVEHKKVFKCINHPWGGPGVELPESALMKIEAPLVG